MTLDTMPPRRPDAATGPIRRVGLAREQRFDRGLPSRSLVLALVLACLTLMVIDKASGDASPVDPVRHVAGEVVSPVEDATSTVLHPIVSIPGALRTNGQLRDRIHDLQGQVDALKAQQATAAYDANRAAELAALRRLARDTGYSLVTASVVGTEPGLALDGTVSIDAGSSDGLHPDMTVVNGSGLVGRITSVSSHSATVVLVTAPGSQVGGRVGDNMQLGIVHGTSALGTGDSLELDLADPAVVPKVGQSVVTWGSRGGAPYVSGVPIGRVVKVYQSLRETSYRAVLAPYADMTSLDTVGIVVPHGTQGPVIDASGSVQEGR